jgi:drug/metabolite transporter (DMT)-like permease
VANLKTQVALAFAAVYIIWGSTYLAIRFVIESLPPFFMAGTRFMIAGAILYLLTRLRGAQTPSRDQWGKAALVGGLMLLGGNGAVVWAEQYLPSGLTSIIVATVPLWIALLSWLSTRKKPNRAIFAGLILGFVGVGLLVGDIGTLGESQVAFLGGIALVFGTLLWASGSLYSRTAKLPSSSLLATAMEMVTGGILLFIASFVTGEWTRIRLDQVSLRSGFSWLYLIVFGSLIGYTSYMWLLKNVNPERVSTYAYVNPVVALFLGWALASETLSIQDIIAALIILTSVAVITTYGAAHKTPEKAKDKG